MCVGVGVCLCVYIYECETSVSLCCNNVTKNKKSLFDKFSYSFND